MVQTDTIKLGNKKILIHMKFEKPIGVSLIVQRSHEIHEVLGSNLLANILESSQEIFLYKKENPNTECRPSLHMANLS